MNTPIKEIENNTKYLKFIIGIISVIGVIMVYSASYMFAKEKYGSSTYFFFKQSLFLVISVGVAYVVSKTKFKFWLKYSFHLNMIASFFVLLTFMPGIGSVVKGANRWLKFGPITVQPGEMIKYTILLSSLYFFENFYKMAKNIKIKHGLSLLVPLVLLVLQPDFGTFSICFAVISFVCFMSSFPRKYFYSSLGIGIVSVLVIMVSQPYRVKRLMAFLDPWKNAQGSGFQVIQSWIGFANGAFFGQGPGNSIEKLFYLPEAHNDFIFSVIGEEFGFLGVFSLVMLFLGLIYVGFKLAVLVKDRTGYILISSIVFTLGIQTFLNMGVVLGLLPTKGLNLPFISYGGSSLICNFFAVGLIFAVVRQCKEHQEMSFSNADSYENTSKKQQFNFSSPRSRIQTTKNFSN